MFYQYTLKIGTKTIFNACLVLKNPFYCHRIFIYLKKFMLLIYFF